MRLVIASVLACFTHAVVATEPIEVSRPGFQCVGGPDGVQLPKTLSALRSVGELKAEEVVRIEEWEGYKTIEKLLRFRGLNLQVVTFTNQPERYNLALADFRSPAWSFAPIRVGQSSAALLGRLGVKQAAPAGAWRFTGESDSVLIEVRRSKVSRVVYECYTG